MSDPANVCPKEEGGGSGDGFLVGSPQQPGSINEVGLRFQPCRINDLELVAQICPRWNPLTSWMRQIEDFQRAA